MTARLRPQEFWPQMSARMDGPQFVGYPSTQEHLYAGEGRERRASQFCVEDVQSPHVLEACARDEAVATSAFSGLSEGVPVATQSVVVGLAQQVDGASPYIHAAFIQEGHLLLVGEVRLGCHGRTPAAKEDRPWTLTQRAEPVVMTSW